VNEAEEAMGYRVALQAALANFFLMASGSPLGSKEEVKAEKRNLGQGDRSQEKLKNNIMQD